MEGIVFQDRFSTQKQKTYLLFLGVCPCNISGFSVRSASLLIQIFKVGIIKWVAPIREEFVDYLSIGGVAAFKNVARYALLR